MSRLVVICVCVCVMTVCFPQVFCEVEVKKMSLQQANADLAEAAEKLEVIRKKLAVSWTSTRSNSVFFSSL